MKFKVIKLISIAIFATELTGCATPVARTGVYKDLGNPDTNQATLFIYREKAFAGSANQYDVLMNGVLVGSLPNGSFFTISTQPGNKNIKADTGMGKGSEIRVEKNKTYCMKMSLNFNVLMKSADIDPVNTEQCDREMNGLTEVRLD